MARCFPRHSFKFQFIHSPLHCSGGVLSSAGARCARLARRRLISPLNHSLSAYPPEAEGPGPQGRFVALGASHGASRASVPAAALGVAALRGAARCCAMLPALSKSRSPPRRPRLADMEASGRRQISLSSINAEFNRKSSSAASPHKKHDLSSFFDIFTEIANRVPAGRILVLPHR